MSAANIHASCIVLGKFATAFEASPDAGVLLLGDSGSGKSDLALRLIERGAVLVADDRTDLSTSDHTLLAAPPQTIAGLLEVRGAGIVRLPYRARARIALVVMLVPPHEVPRLPELNYFSPPSPLMLAEEFCPPLLQLSAFEDSAPAKVALAAAAFDQGRFVKEVNRL